MFGEDELRATDSEDAADGILGLGIEPDFLNFVGREHGCRRARIKDDIGKEQVLSLMNQTDLHESKAALKADFHDAARMPSQ